MPKPTSIIALADGLVLSGRAIGGGGTIGGELVFNTSMAGYQEILTDPSYAGEIITFTFPLIGNYGWTAHDHQSRRIWANGLVVSTLHDGIDNWMAEKTLAARLAEDDIHGIEGVDTRVITKQLRNAGAMNCVITTELSQSEAVKAAQDWPDLAEQDLVGAVTCEKPYDWEIETEPKFKVAAFDCGIKYGILRAMAERGIAARVFPATASAAEVNEWNPDGVFLSNGPGDPQACIHYLKDTILELSAKFPIMGICLGHQLVGLAYGLETYKLKFGHRGANHPVKDLKSGRVHITSQNHGYAVREPGENSTLELSHVNVNDGSVEGFRHKELPVFTVQYHPEGSPGPRDNLYLFDEFAELMESSR